jgi:hypothetical protein
MAYITTEQVKEIRAKITAKFPTKDGWKFSITRENYSGVKIAILQGTANFQNKQGSSILPTRETHPYLQQIYSIANAGNHDNSDSMTDYFDVGWYVWLSVGSWDKEYKFNKK